MRIERIYSALVVTMATREDFVATWSSDLASPIVMVAPITHGIRNDLHGSDTVSWIETDLLWFRADKQKDEAIGFRY